MNRQLFIVVALIAGITTCLSAQYKIGIIPRVSPDKAIYEKIGYTEMKISYGSPSVNNRQIWGDLVAYDKVWRAGANEATTLEISNDITINEHTLPEGKYTIFIIPHENDLWEVIFNTKADQWGSWGYDPSLDILRLTTLPKRTKTNTEKLTYSIESYGFNHGRILMNWEHIELDLEFSTNYLNHFITEIENQANEASRNVQGVIYLQGAEYLENTGNELTKAQQWIEKSKTLLQDVKDWNKQYYPIEYILDHNSWIGAKIYARLGEYNKAIEEADKIIADNRRYYSKKNDVERIDTYFSKWNDIANSNK